MAWHTSNPCNGNAGYDRHAITARAKSSQKLGANVRRRPRAINVQTKPIEIFTVIILAIPSENVSEGECRFLSGNIVDASRLVIKRGYHRALTN